MTETTVQAEPLPTGEPLSITYDGSPWSLAGLGLLNFFLTLITLGIYSFWGRTEVRKRIWSSVRLNGEPLEYTGTGKELFLGFLIVFFVVLLPFLLAYLAAIIFVGPALAALVLFAFYAIVGFLFGVGVYRARRYRLSRTRWRGIRGAMVGSDWSYAWGHFWTAILSIFTGGWLAPWRSNYLYRRLTNDARFGEQPFSYNGKAGPLYPPFAMAWVGGIIAYLGLIGGIFGYMYATGKLAELEDGGDGTTPQLEFTFLDNMAVFAMAIVAMMVFALFAGWYQARTLNVLTNGTRYQNLKLKCEVWGAGVIWMFISNYLMTLLTLGILKPVADARWTKYLIDRISTEGTVDFASIAQSQAAMDRRGEGLAEAFDIDAFG